MQTRDDRETAVIRNDFANVIASIEREQAATAAAGGTIAAIKRVPLEMRNYPETSLARKLAAAAGLASLSGNHEIFDMILAVQKHQSRARCATTPRCACRCMS